MDKKVLEVVLRRFGEESNIKRVIDVEATPAVPKGENYLSVILRLKLKVVLGDGRVARRSFILKKLITTDTTGEWAKEHNTNMAEIDIYCKVHPEMEYLMQEFEDTDETLWCKFIHYEPETASIVLEDLKSTGFRLVPRQTGLDLEHGILAIRGLGRYHGMAKILETRRIISKNSYSPYPLVHDKGIVKCFMWAGLKLVRKAMLEWWSPKWKDLATKFSLPDGDAFLDALKKLAKYDETDFTVLNHGDCWSNNMMFRYNWQGHPISVKFLDYQIPHYNSPCLDITNFLYSSLQPRVRRQNFALLLENYHDSLIRTLDKFGYEGSKPTFEEISVKMDNLQYFGLSFFISGYAAIVCQSTEAFDLEKLLKTEGEEGFNENILKEEGIEEKMGPDLIDYIHKFSSA